MELDERERVISVLKKMLENNRLSPEERDAVNLAITDIDDRWTYRYRSARLQKPEPGSGIRCITKPGTVKSAEGISHDGIYMAAGYVAIGDEVISLENVYQWRYLK